MTCPVCGGKMHKHCALEVCQWLRCNNIQTCHAILTETGRWATIKLSGQR